MSKVSISGNASGTGTFTIASPNGNTDRTINLPDSNGTILTTATAGVPINGPAFSAYPSAATTLSANTWTKINYATELWDTNSNYASSRFTPTVAGYYQINAAFGEGLSASQMTLYIAIYKNGSSYKLMQYITANAWYTNVPINALVYCNGTTDYIEIYAYTGSAYTNDTKSATNFFEGFLARSAT